MSEVRQVRGVSCVCKLIWCPHHNGWWCLCCNSLQLPGLSARVKQGVTELYDESLSLAAAQTTTDPKKKIQITQRTNALHLRHHHLSKNLVWNVLMIFQKQKCFLLSLLRGPVFLLLLFVLSQLLDPGCQSLCIHQDGVPHFLWSRHPAHLLASHPILLFQAVSGGNEMLQLW